LNKCRFAMVGGKQLEFIAESVDYNAHFAPPSPRTAAYLV
jgi:hypothetical protein